MEKEPAISSENEIYIMNPSGNTGDIIQSILEADKFGVEQVEDFAHTMQGEDILETCANLYHWVRQHIPYQEDPSGLQLILLPGQLYANRKREYGGTGLGGDCKSMSLFCSSVLRALGNYDFQYRFSSERPNTDFHHVYLVVRCGDEYIPLDCTHKEFCTEFPYAKKKDIAPRQPASLAASTAPGHRIAGIGITQAEFNEQYWENEYNAMKNNIDAIRDNVYARCIDGIKDKWKGKLLRRDKALKAFKDLWNNMLTYTSCVIYKYWNDQALMSYYASRPGITNPGPVPFTQEYNPKRSTSLEFYATLKEVGVRESDVRDLVNLGVWYQYGTTLDYQLYRCYCMELYGQPFAPVPGVPYYDVRQGLLKANGASLQDVIGIGLCFPAQGGIGRPFGEPYWSVGGYIISNGATEEQVNEWAKTNYRPGTPIFFNGVQIDIVPGNIANNGNGITESQQALALDIYNKWRNGNMVVLPDSPQKTPISITDISVIEGAGIGTGMGGAEVMAIVVAVMAAVSALVGIIAKILEVTKQQKDPSRVAMPPVDYKWEYRTVDGCYIGVCVNPAGCNGATRVKICNGKITETNPDTTKPENQPAGGGGFGGGFGSKTTMVVAGGAMAAGGILLMD